MKSRQSDWQPLDLVDKEAVKPLRSFNSRAASGDHRYYTLDTNEHSVFDADLDDNDDDEDDEAHVEFIGKGAYSCL